ncbi:hypothetical protein D9M68_721020 [compost metagenome]
MARPSAGRRPPGAARSGGWSAPAGYRPARALPARASGTRTSTRTRAPGPIRGPRGWLFDPGGTSGAWARRPWRSRTGWPAAPRTPAGRSSWCRARSPPRHNRWTAACARGPAGRRSPCPTPARVPVAPGLASGHRGNATRQRMPLRRTSAVRPAGAVRRSRTADRRPRPALSGPAPALLPLPCRPGAGASAATGWQDPGARRRCRRG